MAKSKATIAAEAVAAELAQLKATLAAMQAQSAPVAPVVPAAAPVVEPRAKLPLILAAREAKYAGSMWLDASGKIVSHSTKGATYVEFMSPLAILDNSNQIGIPADRVREFLNVGLTGLSAAWEREPKNDRISADWAAREVEIVGRVDEDGPVMKTDGRQAYDVLYFGAGLRAVYGPIADRATPDFPATIHAHLGRLASLLCRSYKFVANDLMPTLVPTITELDGSVRVGTGRLPLPTVIKGKAVLFPVFNYVREANDGHEIKAWRDDSGRLRKQVTTVSYSPDFILNYLSIGFGFEVEGGVRPESAVGLGVLGEKLFGMKPFIPTYAQKSATMRVKSDSKAFQTIEITL